MFIYEEDEQLFDELLEEAFEKSEIERREHKELKNNKMFWPGEIKHYMNEEFR